MHYTPADEHKITEEIYKTSINGLYYVAHKTFTDERGFFSEVGKIPEIEAVTGFTFPVKQISHARSNQNVVRGIHAENWNKYVAVVSGVAFSAIIDLRPESGTFMKQEIFILGHGANALDGSLFIPARCGNSMCVVAGPVDYIYMFDQLYKERDVSGDIAVSLFDPDLKIIWPIPKDQMIISDRDRQAITVREKFPEKFQ